MTQFFREMAPADMARHVDRERRDFVQNVVENLSPWTLAKFAARQHEDGYSCECLRGLFDLPKDGLFRMRWWPASRASHSMGAMMLGMSFLPRQFEGMGTYTEIEINTDPEGRLYLDVMAGGAFTFENIALHPCLRGCFNDQRLAIRGRDVFANQKTAHLWPVDGSKPRALDATRQGIAARAARCETMTLEDIFAENDHSASASVRR